MLCSDSTQQGARLSLPLYAVGVYNLTVEVNFRKDGVHAVPDDNETSPLFLSHALVYKRDISITEDRHFFGSGAQNHVRDACTLNGPWTDT